MDDIKGRAQKQFGAHAENFVTSVVHAQGESLQRLIGLTQPQPNWIVVDVATGGGHNALAFARHVRSVIATDLTAPMLIAARRFIGGSNLSNLSYCRVDAELLPFRSESIDCVTCRIAPHHFPNVAAFMTESARTIKPGGLVAIADNVSSGDSKTAEYTNALEKLRDPSHHWAYALHEWETFFHDAGLELVTSEVFEKDIDFTDWAGRLGVSGDHAARLKTMIIHAPKQPAKWLNPREAKGRLVFTLREAVSIGRKTSTSTRGPRH